MLLKVHTHFTYCCYSTPPLPTFSVCERQFALVEGIEVGMKKGHASRDSLVRVQGSHSLQEVHAHLVQILSVLMEGDTLPFREGWLKIGQFQGLRPVLFVRGA